MALLSQQLERFLLSKYKCYSFKPTTINNKSNNGLTVKPRSRSCSAIAIDAPASISIDVANIRWGSASFQGAREEMEDDLVLRSDGLSGFSFAAVFDGHAGFSSVQFLRFRLFAPFRGLSGYSICFNFLIYTQNSNFN